MVNTEDHNDVINTYDPNTGSLVKVEDAKGNATRYEYNGFMAIKKVIFPGDTYEQLTYDGFGRVKTKTVRQAGNSLIDDDHLPLRHRRPAAADGR